MSDTEPSERVRRDPPARRGPKRSMLTPTPAPLSGDFVPPTGPASAMGAAVDEGMRAAWRMMDGATQTMQGAVERGVETAYMVIDEYMLRGRQAARRYSPRSNGDTGMNDDRYQQQQNGYNNTAGWGPMGPMNPMMMPWLQMMRMWADAMTSFVPGAATMGADWMNQWVPGTYAPNASGQRSSVSVYLSSKQPAEVTVEVSPGADAMTLRAEPLVHASSTDAPPLAGIGLETGGGRLRIRVTIPNDQPPGAYRGALVDSAGVHRGTLRVDIEALRRARSRAAGV